MFPTAPQRASGRRNPLWCTQFARKRHVQAAPAADFGRWRLTLSALTDRSRHWPAAVRRLSATFGGTTSGWRVTRTLRSVLLAVAVQRSLSAEVQVFNFRTGVVYNRHMPNIVITGTSRGIGFATALELARAGHAVVATMRNPAGSPELREQAAKEKLPLRIETMDVDSDESVKVAFGQILAQGPVDVLVSTRDVCSSRRSAPPHEFVPFRDSPTDVSSPPTGTDD